MAGSLVVHGLLPCGLGGQEFQGLSRANDALLNFALLRSLATFH